MAQILAARGVRTSVAIDVRPADAILAEAQTDHARRPAGPSAAPESPAAAWTGYRVPLVVWLCAVSMMALLLLEDLIRALLFR